MRRTFKAMPIVLRAPQLLVQHDDDAEVYLNGKKVLELRGSVPEYIPMTLSEEARKALKEGENVLAVHCRRRDEGQYIDVGMEEWKMPEGRGLILNRWEFWRGLRKAGLNFLPRCYYFVDIFQRPRYSARHYAPPDWLTGHAL